MVTIGKEPHDEPIKMKAGHSTIWGVTFAANGEYLVSGDEEGVRVWRVEDSRQVATMAADLVRCLTVSKDGKWIAVGTSWSGVILLNAKTFETVLTHWETTANYVITGVDFSPDSTRFVVASSDGTTTVWDVATRERVLILHHEDRVIAAKYSPQGDRIATATHGSVRLYDSSDGRLLANININVTPWYHFCLLWFNNHVFILSDGKIKQIDPSTQSAVSEWPVPDTDRFSCIVLSQLGNFIAYSANRTVTLWDTSTHTQLGQIQHPKDIRSIALSPDDRFLAIGSEDGRITIENLRDVLPPSCFAVSILYFQIQ